ncbi:MAG TPA: chloramphenicol acetyltransferase [Clostridia bacterium]|nr:chloramphenicol acetyltransferase [Clostridia bacterium]
MKNIDIENWNRKDHFNYFKQFDYPHFNVCANIDITRFYKHIKVNGLPFFISMVYAASKAANSVREFRYRIRGDGVVEHETANPSFTVMTENEVFNYCTAPFTEDFSSFKTKTSELIEKARRSAGLDDDPSRDDLLYITSLPWVSFTSITHPIQMHPVDSIPRISWGRFFEDEGYIKLPLSVQAHHAIVDGMHVGNYFGLVQEILNDPKKYL